MVESLPQESLGQSRGGEEFRRKKSAGIKPVDRFISGSRVAGRHRFSHAIQHGMPAEVALFIRPAGA
jgi:hypothetical protein